MAFLQDCVRAPVRFLHACEHLFSPKKFRIHRLFGLVYLIQFAVAVALEVSGETDNVGRLYVLLPLCGWVQAIIAARTFTFLPKGDEKAQGYYHPTKAMSYDFVVENIYFSGLLLFHSVYMSREFGPVLRRGDETWGSELVDLRWWTWNDFPKTLYLVAPHVWALAIEILGVFLPYQTVRRLFPKSSFRNTTSQKTSQTLPMKLKNDEPTASESTSATSGSDGEDEPVSAAVEQKKDVDIKSFLPKEDAASVEWTAKYARFVKLFYVIAKHFGGFYMNYLIFLGIMGEDPVREKRVIRLHLLLGGWGTTIAMFLQTLKFRRYIGPTTAAILYAGAFPFFYGAWSFIAVIAMEHTWLSTLTFLGLAINFAPYWAQLAWQLFVGTILYGVRFGLINTNFLRRIADVYGGAGVACGVALLWWTFRREG